MLSDVCLILEGTYPYVAGGVSTWVAQILHNMPDIKFSILYLGASADAPRELKYKLPVNVTEIREVFVHDFPRCEPEPKKPHLLAEADWLCIEDFQHALFEGRAVDFAQLRQILLKLPDRETFVQEFAYSRRSWQAATKLYQRPEFNSLSFIDFYWTFRLVNMPMMQLLLTPVIPAKVYHTACTGYAGAVGALLSQLTRKPLLVSEHGIYTRERRIDIFDAEWICGTPDIPLSLDMARKSNFFKEWWVNFFLGLSRSCYNNAAQIFSLFEANRRDQIADGASTDKVKIIPNGIDVSSLIALPPRQKKEGDPFVVGYVGRIAPIKDVKTLIRSLDLLKSEEVNFKALLMGPLDEDEEYAAECRELVSSLGLSAEVEFTGRVSVHQRLPDIDVMVISSISEGLPFAILEAGCAGIPVVATDVGACRELLEGRTPDDRALGKGGITVPVASPSELARALAKLAGNPQLARSMGENSRRRARKYYSIVDVMHAYRKEYEYWFEISETSNAEAI